VISTQHGRGTFILDPEERLGDNQKKPAETIEELTKFYIRKATYLGFKPEEIRDFFVRIMDEED
jgi:DNA-binding transcriptional regulator YhcF (GntR family)